MTTASWYPSEYYKQPGYSKPWYSRVPRIEIEDTVAPPLGPLRKAWWRRARTKALAMWAAGGLEFVVTETPPGLLYRNDGITLARTDVPDPIAAWAAFQHPPCPGGSVNCGWVQLDPLAWEQAWKARNLGRMKYLIAHELGHCLGFGHGGTGVMAERWTTNRVNEEELAALRAYWL